MTNLKLDEAAKNGIYFVSGLNLPVKTAKRLEALGMTSGAKITVLNKKNSALVVEFRGTRFALGKSIAKNIYINKQEAAGEKN